MRKSLHSALLCILMMIFGLTAKAAPAGFVDDPAAPLAANSYITISCYYNGSYFYLGVDTVKAKLATPEFEITAYSEPSLATMWQIGRCYSTTGEIDWQAGKGYQRGVKSVWLKEKKSVDKFLSLLGACQTTYHDMGLVDSLDANMWYMQKTRAERHVYVEGSMYYFSDATGVDVYHYIKYDPLYGFKRCVSQSPGSIMRLVEWSRVKGDEMHVVFHPASVLFGYNMVGETKTITGSLYFTEDADYFNNRFDNTNGFYASKGHQCTGSEAASHASNLAASFSSSGTNKAIKTFYSLEDGTPALRTDSVQIKIGAFSMQDDDDPETGDFSFELISSDGSPIDWYSNAACTQTLTDIIDHLRIQFTLAESGKVCTDSMQVTRKVYHKKSKAPMSLTFYNMDNGSKVYNKDYAFANDAQATETYYVEGFFKDGYDLLDANNQIIRSEIGQETPIDIAGATTYFDTLWIPVIENGDTIDVTYNSNEVWICDSVMVRVTANNGMPLADNWLTAALDPSHRDRIILTAAARGMNNKSARVYFQYRFRHSANRDDMYYGERFIIVTQDGTAASAPWAWSGNRSPFDEDFDTYGQRAHEQHYTMYAIPGEKDFALPINRHYYGWYRWYDYENQHDIENEPLAANDIHYTSAPKKGDAAFYPINVSRTYSHGIFEADFDKDQPINNPEIEVPTAFSTTTHERHIACDVSAYCDLEVTGYGDDGSTVKEPTLSYRKVFDLESGAKMADRMEVTRTNFDSETKTSYVDVDTIVAPSGRPVYIKPRHHYATNQNCTNSELGYVYYFDHYYNLKDSTNIGKKSHISGKRGVASPLSYSRVGLQVDSLGLKTAYDAPLLNYDSLNNMANGSTRKIIILSPQTNVGGYVLGNNGGTLKRDGSGFSNQSACDTKATTIAQNQSSYTYYVLNIKKVSANNYQIYTGTGNNTRYLYYNSGECTWSKNSQNWQIVQQNNIGSSYIISNYKSNYVLKLNPYKNGSLVSNALQSYKHSWWTIIGLIYFNSGTSAITTCDGVDDHYDEADSRFDWYIYGINERLVGNPDDIHHQKEVGYWQSSTNGTTWTTINNPVIDEYGNLEVQENTANTVKYYRLVTKNLAGQNHFKLYKAKVTFIEADQANVTAGGLAIGPSHQAIFTEEQIEQNYDVLMDMDYFFTEGWFMGQKHYPNARLPKGTDYDYLLSHMYPWSYLEFAYHYPASTTELQGTTYVESLGRNINKRKYDTDELQNGEYCITNKFTRNGVTVEDRRGAANGWMLHYRGANESLCMMDYSVPASALGCPSQQTFLTAYVRALGDKNDVSLRCFVYGKHNGDPEELVLSFNSGVISRDGWQQVMIPMTNIMGGKYDLLRIRLFMSAAPGSDLLIDDFRVLGKKRPVIVSQAKATTCLTGDVNDSIILNFRYCYSESESQMEPGTLLAYQIARKSQGESDYTVLKGYKGDGTHSGVDVYPCYLVAGTGPLDNSNFRDQAGNEYGLIPIPERTYDPRRSGTQSGQSTVVYNYLDMMQSTYGNVNLGGASIDRRVAFINEQTNVTTKEAMANGTAKVILQDGPHSIVRGYVLDSISPTKKEWWIYIVAKVPAAPGDTFRITTTTTTNPSSYVPDFGKDECGNESYIAVKKPLTLLTDGVPHVNRTRAEAEAAGTLFAGNKTYTFSIQIEGDDGTGGTTTGRAMFDYMRAFEFDRNYYSMTAEQQLVADVQFEATYGYKRTQVMDALDIFRANVPDNDAKMITDWAEVTSSMFTYNGQTQAYADSVYNILNSLVMKKYLMIGLPGLPMSVPANVDGYAWICPIPASGFSVRHIEAIGDIPAHDDTIPIPLCDSRIWGELHTANVPYQLRFGTRYAYESDPLNLPVVRATAAQANSQLDVRVDTISVQPDGEGGVVAANCVILGWDSTQVILTNDPEWNAMVAAHKADAANHPMPSFRYSQDKILQEKDFAYYYKTDSIIHFTPVDAAHITQLNTAVSDGKNKWNVPVSVHPGYQTPNNFTLKAGYWYQFTTTMMNLNLSPYVGGLEEDKGTPARDADPNYTRMGEASFILLVAPDTAIWTPQYPGTANYWDEDRNWTMIVNGKEVNERIRVPMEDTKVIIPAQTSPELYPYVRQLTDAEMLRRDNGYQANSCSDMLFRPNAMMYGQQFMDYERVFTDVKLTTGEWRTFATPLTGIVSGDIYIPNNTAKDADFAPLRFDDPSNGSIGSTYNRSKPYAFWQSLWNSSVSYAFLDTDHEGIYSTYTKSSAEWVFTNTLDEPYTPGKGVTLLCFDESNTEGEELTVKLPKQETTYTFYMSDGTPKEVIDLHRAELANRTQNLDYDKTNLAKAGGTGITYDLKNETASKQYIFGNPTLAYINVYQLCVDNADLLESTNGVFSVHQISHSTWSGYEVSKDGDYYLKPGEAIALTAKDAGTLLQLKVTPAAISLLANESPFGMHAPRRMAHAKADATLYIKATNMTEDGKAVAYLKLGERGWADDKVMPGEDAISLTSGLNPDGTASFDYNSAYTPLTMFSVCENKELALDLRQDIENVPLGFTLLEGMVEYDTYTTLSFALDGQWDKALWLYDIETGDSLLIRNGGVISVPTPASGHIRYYINYTGKKQPAISTRIESAGSMSTIDTHRTDNTSSVTKVYDIMGRMVMTLGQDQLISHLNLPSGVYLIQCGDKVERVVVK